MITLSGRLDKISLGSILSFLEMEKKSGLLIVKSLQTGRIFLNKGEVVDATINKLSGLLSLYQILNWKSGVFEFTEIKVQMFNKINMSTTNILLEAACMADEAREYVRRSNENEKFISVSQ